MLAALAEKCRLVPSTHIWQLTSPLTPVAGRSHPSSLQGHLCSHEHTHTYLKKYHIELYYEYTVKYCNVPK